MGTYMKALADFLLGKPSKLIKLYKSKQGQAQEEFRERLLLDLDKEDYQQLIDLM